MRVNRIKSDQLYKGSDYNEKQVCFLFATKKERPGSAAFTSRGLYPSRFFARALQTLWKAGMQMCRISRSWSKVLFINEFSQKIARDGLCSIGLQRAGRKVFKNSSGCAGYSGRNLYDQSGTPSPKEEIVKITKQDEDYNSSAKSEYVGSFDGRNYSGQYARGLFERGDRIIFCRGGL